MARRVLGLFLCGLLLSAASFDFLADASQKNAAAMFEFETSWIAPEVLDDSTEGRLPSHTVAWSRREKIVAQWIPDTTPRRIKFSPAAIRNSGGIANFRQTFQDLFHFQEVCRI